MQKSIKNTNFQNWPIRAQYGEISAYRLSLQIWSSALRTLFILLVCHIFSFLFLSFVKIDSESDLINFCDHVTRKSKKRRSMDISILMSNRLNEELKNFTNGFVRSRIFEYFNPWWISWPSYKVLEKWRKYGHGYSSQIK